MKKPFAIGVDDFQKLRESGYYYVDKTLFLKELLDQKGEVKLFTRPRRFGKTLTLSMIQCFFEKNQNGEDLFDGLEIMEAGKKYSDYMGKYPVISLSLKSAKQPNYEMAYGSMVIEIANEFERHRYLLESDEITYHNKTRYRAIMEQKAAAIEYGQSLAFLSRLLEEYYQKKVIILIDEYDVPLENAYMRGYYEEMIGFISSLFEAALKTNSSLEFAVVTGCLRISRESIFTGLNNLEVNSVLSNQYAEFFGFTQEEVDNLLREYDLKEYREVTKEWYDGYLFGKEEVYNPWSVINYVKSLTKDRETYPRPYWANTSSNQIVRKLIEHSDLQLKQEIEDLVAGGTIKKPVYEEITYGDIDKSSDNLWNFLFFTGYLRKEAEWLEGVNHYVALSLPNLEVKYIYENMIQGWFQENIARRDLTILHQAMFMGNAVTFQEEVSKVLQGSISYWDSQEAFYHGFLLGICSNLTDYLVQSNRESGQGRYDILVRSLDVAKTPVIIEIKIADAYGSMEKEAENALKQIEEKHYTSGLLKEGYQECICLGIAFYKKQCHVKAEKVSLKI